MTPTEKQEYDIIASNGRTKFNKHIFLKHLGSRGLVIPTSMCPKDCKVSFDPIQFCFQFKKKEVSMQDNPVLSSSPRRYNLFETNSTINDFSLSTTVIASNVNISLEEISNKSSTSKSSSAVVESVDDQINSVDLNNVIYENNTTIDHNIIAEIFPTNPQSVVESNKSTVGIRDCVIKLSRKDAMQPPKPPIAKKAPKAPIKTIPNAKKRKNMEDDVSESVDDVQYAKISDQSIIDFNKSYHPELSFDNNDSNIDCSQLSDIDRKVDKCLDVKFNTKINKLMILLNFVGYGPWWTEIENTRRCKEIIYAYMSKHRRLWNNLYGKYENYCNENNIIPVYYSYDEEEKNKKVKL